ncbi:aspartate-semialdehyde dehydrogenase [Clostridia bacterium]|nr:aspartate-semialdehyde dehydrogenase [Clostridia bacterium]
MSESKLNVGIIGATGYVGQRFVTLLENHPWFSVAKLAASANSAGKTYEESVRNRFKLELPIPEYVKNMPVYDIAETAEFCDGLDFVFCAVNMRKGEIRVLEEKIAKLEVPVVSNNSAFREREDVPIIIPEINPEHSKIIEVQRKNWGTKRGFIAAKPNCSIQSYVPALTPLRSYGIDKISVCTYQAISGAGKVLADTPEILGNVVPFIGGEEEKSESEPLKVWGTLTGEAIVSAKDIAISAQCYRVPVQEGHTAAVSVTFNNKITKGKIINIWESYVPEIYKYKLPSAPKKFLTYLDKDNRPQPLLDANIGNGMGISIGRLREDNIFDYKFACLSHNTIRGAAGGAVLTAELLKVQGYL